MRIVCTNWNTSCRHIYIFLHFIVRVLCWSAGTRLAHVTDLCVRPGFMLLMLGCMGTFPCGSFCLFFWWRSRRRRPSSSHHDDSRAASKKKQHNDTHRYSRVSLLLTQYHLVWFHLVHVYGRDHKEITNFYLCQLQSYFYPVSSLCAKSCNLQRAA